MLGCVIFPEIFITSRRSFVSVLQQVRLTSSSSFRTKSRFRPKNPSEYQISNSHNQQSRGEHGRKKGSSLPPSCVFVNGEILYGIYPVLMAVKSGKRKVHQIYYNKDSSRTEGVIRLATSKGISSKCVGRDSLNKLSRNSTKEINVHQGICADVDKVLYNN